MCSLYKISIFEDENIFLLHRLHTLIGVIQRLISRESERQLKRFMY